MQRQRGELVPIGDALSGMGGPVKTIRDASPQAARHGDQFVSSLIAERGEFWWNERKPDEPMLWDSKIYLGEAFFNEIIRHPVPLDMNTLTVLKRSPLGLEAR